jgi:hypothetical protein
LVAFGEHVRSTIQRDSDSHPVSHWWQGPNPRRPFIKDDKSPNPALMYFADQSNSNALREFDHTGCETLARNLAVRSFQLLEVYYVTGHNKRYFEKAAEEAGPDPLADYIQNVPVNFDAEEDVIIHPTYRGLVNVDPRVRVEKKKSRISATMLAKRSPDREQRSLTVAEKCKRYRGKKNQSLTLPEQLEQKRCKREKNKSHYEKRLAGKSVTTASTAAFTER